MNYFRVRSPHYIGNEDGPSFQVNLRSLCDGFLSSKLRFLRYTRRWCNRSTMDQAARKSVLLLLTSRTKRGKALFYFIMLKKRCVTSSRLCRRAEMILKRQKRNLLSTSTPKRMSSMKLATFSKRNRIHGESMNAYHSRLRQLASTCEFANIDKEIKSQIIQPCSSQALAANLQQSDFTSLRKDRQMSTQALSKSLLMSVIN